MTAKPPTFTAADIRRLLAEHEDSDLSLAAFARERGIAPFRLYDARRRARLREESRAFEPLDGDTFAEVRLTATSAPTPLPIELALPSGYSLRLGRDFDEVTLRRLLGVLGSC